MIHEYKSEIEIAGDTMPAIIRYERSRFDGHPLIHSIIVSRIDLLPILKEWQIGVFESEILADDLAAVMDWQADNLDSIVLRRTA